MSLRTLIDYVLENNDDLARSIIAYCDSVSERVDNCERCNCASLRESMRLIVDLDEKWCENCLSYAYEHTNGKFYSEDETVIPEYHYTDLDIPSDVLEMKDILGIELETYQTDLEGCKNFCERNLVSNGWKYERDGSLDEEYGVEIVAIPYTLREIKDANSLWRKTLNHFRRIGATAWDAGEGYGMHISLNGDVMTSLHRAKVVRFINDNKDLSEKIGRRPENIDYFRFKKDKISISHHDDDDKYCAATNRESRIEIRIFRSTLNENSFIRNCEFVDAVRVYTENCGINSYELSEEAFLLWLALPDNRTTYPSLADFLGVSMKQKLEVGVEQ